jgi:primosomal protein N' (replication factor Y)
VAAAGGKRVVRVLPDVPAIDKAFDYLVPEPWEREVRVGTMVRIQLHGRRVGGWVMEDDVSPPAGVSLKPLAKVTGWGPSAEIIELAGWAATRWAGRRASLLKTASPSMAVRGLPQPSLRTPPPGDVDGTIADALGAPGGRAVLRLPPADDVLPVVLAAARRGRALVVSPSAVQSTVVAEGLRRLGVGVAVVPRDWAQAAAGARVVIGARAAAWAPCLDLAAVVVLDGHDEGLQQEQAPTWNAWVVAAERAGRAGVPCVIVSPCPTLELLAWGPVVAPSRTAERTGWAALEIVDRRRDDPHTGLYSPRLVGLIRDGGQVVCVLNRKGRARLLACAACGSLARCEVCGAAVGMAGEPGTLSCARCGTTRPTVCLECGSTRLKMLRVGVSRVREELEALTGRPVGEVTAETGPLPTAAVLVGTEAVLHRAGPVDGVAFLDFDQELLAPRFRAAEEALALLARASRLVGGRRRGGRVLVQTRVPAHEALVAALTADPGRLSVSEAGVRAALRLPPESAVALVSGEAAPAFVASLSGVEVMGPDRDRWLIKAADHEALSAALTAVSRPPGRLRIEVDPLRM